MSTVVDDDDIDDDRRLYEIACGRDRGVCVTRCRTFRGASQQCRNEMVLSLLEQHASNVWVWERECLIVAQVYDITRGLLRHCFGGWSFSHHC